jgi:hypothetical protein
VRSILLLEPLGGRCRMIDLSSPTIGWYRRRASHELTAMAAATRAIDMATIAVDSHAAGEATLGSALELILEAGQLAGRAHAGDWPSSTNGWRDMNDNLVIHPFVWLRDSPGDQRCVPRSAVKSPPQKTASRHGRSFIWCCERSIGAQTMGSSDQRTSGQADPGV